MVTENHYRWDFIGLSTDQKPGSDNPKVTDGSTFYCSDNSKLYVWYKNQWYEKTATGGGTSYTAGDGITISDDTISVDTTTIQPKLTAGTNVSIDSETNTISATDTTYSNFVGTDGTSAGTAGLVPAPAITDTDKYLKSDGTWASAGGGGDTVYSNKNTSNSNTGGAVYIGNLNSSQEEQPDPTTTDNHYKYFWALPSANSAVAGDKSICILGKTNNEGSGSITIGDGAINDRGSGIIIGGFQPHSTSTLNGTNGIAIGTGVYSGEYGTEGHVAIGFASKVTHSNSIALGSRATTSRVGELNIGTGTMSEGYNNTNFRVIGGVHDGQNNHDAATVAQGNTLSTTAPTTSTEGVLGQLYTDTTNMHTYQCTAIDTTDPDNPSYTWTQRW